MKRFILTIALLGSVLVSASNASNEFVLPLENKVVLESIVGGSPSTSLECAS